MISDEEDGADDVTEDLTEEKEVERCSFVVELWSRAGAGINANELHRKFNAAWQQPSTRRCASTTSSGCACSSETPSMKSTRSQRRCLKRSTRIWCSPSCQ